jgi:hypothetical protein
MAKNLKNILQNVKDIAVSENTLTMLLDYERVLDEMNLYAFQNWKLGELIEGPNVGKYRISCTFMWPFSLMPDPAGAERLLIFGAKIKWGKDWLEYPVKIKSPDDFKPGTKKPRMTRKQIWTVEINLPKHLIRTIQQGSEDILNSTMSLEDIDSAYEKGYDKMGVNQEQTDQAIGDEMAAATGEEMV